MDPVAIVLRRFDEDLQAARREHVTTPLNEKSGRWPRCAPRTRELSAAIRAEGRRHRPIAVRSTLRAMQTMPTRQ